MKLMSEVDLKSNSNSTTTEIPPPEVTVVTPEMTSSHGRVSKNRKCIIIAVVTISALVVVAIATLTGVKFYLDAKVTIEQIRLQDGSVTIDEESVTDNIDNNQLLMYHIEDKNNDVTMWVITDMRRGIQVTKTVSGSGELAKMCTVTPLDIIAKTGPSGQDISSMSLNSTDSSKNPVIFILSDWPILDTSMVGPYAEKLCQGIDIYWAYPSCPTTNSQTNDDEERSLTGLSITRRRRQTRTCYYQQCKYDAGNCYYTSYANDGRKYYYCRCTYQYMPYSC